MSSAFGTETVLDVRHWTDDYFSFTTTRDDGFRFDNGQFVMIGLQVEQPDGSRRPLLRARDSLAMAEHAASLGLIASRAVAEVATEVRHDQQRPELGEAAVDSAVEAGMAPT